MGAVNIEEATIAVEETLDVEGIPEEDPEESTSLSPVTRVTTRTSSVGTCLSGEFERETPSLPDGDVETGYRTPGTDISNVSCSTSTKPEKATKKRNSSQTIADFRKNQMRCMEALRKGARAQAVVKAIRQTSEPASRIGEGEYRMSKQISEEEESVYSERFSENASFLSREDSLVADPLVAVVKGLSTRQYQAQEELLSGIGLLRQEAAVQRQEMQDVLRKHALALDELKRGRSNCCSVLKLFAAALGGGLGLAAALRLDLAGQVCGKVGSCVEKYREQLQHQLPVLEGKSFVLMQKPNMPQTLVSSMPRSSRGRRRVSQ
mmetsp:Transcript_122402/g.357313  ORF Transcript_122402/g.357313 Transcript_122402/m.357313 type:complete len:321 (-) Transcript_122402:94-1056(-)